MQDENTMFFVVMHELAHIMSVKYAHDNEFWNNFKELIQVAIECKQYTYQNYHKHKEVYCGHSIHDTPLVF